MTIEFDQKDFNRFYSLGLISQGLLPRIDREHYDLNITFKIDEILHFVASAQLRKIKKVTTRIKYRGLTASIKICKGLHYRVGSIGLETKTQEVLDIESIGLFYITNERLGFISDRKQFAIPFHKILSFELSNGGVLIFKEGKESPYIVTMEDYEVPLSMISLILNGG